MFKYLCLIILLISTIVNGQTPTPTSTSTPTPTPTTDPLIGGLTSNEISYLERYFNVIRSYSNDYKVQLPVIQYNQLMAQTLYAHTSKCDNTSSPDALYNMVGEFKIFTNIVNLNDIIRVINISRTWYDFETKSCMDGKVCFANFILSQNTTEFACAKSKCGYGYSFYCNFGPMGTSLGLLPFNYDVETLTIKPIFTLPPTNTPAPTQNPAGSIDWKNYLTPIRNQGGCGSCWAFAAVAVLESRFAIKKGVTSPLINLSEQNPLNCISNHCSGSWPYKVFEQLFPYGVSYETSEPYTAAATTCVLSKTPRFKWVSHGKTGLTKQDFINELSKGPIAVALYADSGFQAYHSGIYSCPVQHTSVNHAVLLYGYNKAGDYWLIKNSWGTGWGNAGTIKISASNDRCNMLQYAASFARV